MNGDPVRIEKKGSISVIYLCTKTNILGPKTNPCLRSALCEVANDPETRVIVLAGNGEKSWVAGADLKTMQHLDPVAAVDFITDLHQLCAQVCGLDKPVIASINGHCYGSGLELAVSCDFLLASDRASFGMQEVVLGMPSVIEAALLPFIVGLSRTREWLLLGEVFDAKTAEISGLVNRVVEHRLLKIETLRWAEKFAALPPHALKIQKQLINSWLNNAGLEASIKNGIDAFGHSYSYNITQPILKKPILKKMFDNKK